MYELKSECGLTMIIDDSIGESNVIIKDKDGDIVINAYINLDSFQDRGVIEGVADDLSGVEIENV